MNCVFVELILRLNELKSYYINSVLYDDISAFSPIMSSDIKLQQAIYHKQKGNDSFKNGNYKEAVQHYSTAIECNTKQPTIYANRAMCYLKLKEYSQAKSDCDKALILDSTYVKAYYRRGIAQINLECLEEAKNDFEMILLLEPTNSDARKELKLLGHVTEKPFEGDIFPIEKPKHLRSKKPLRRIAIKEVNTKPSICVISQTDSLLNGSMEVQMKSTVDSPAKDTVAENVASSSDFPATKDTVMLKDSSVGENVITVHSPEAKDTVAENDTSSSDFPAMKDTVDSLEITNLTVPGIPRTSYQFLTDWNWLRREPKLLAQYFMQIPIEKYDDLFQENFDGEMLSDILVAIETNCENSSFLERLLAVIKLNRFDMVTMFMDENDRKRLDKILCSNETAETKTSIDTLRQAFQY